MELSALKIQAKNTVLAQDLSMFEITSLFDGLPLEQEWAFAKATRADTSYATHGYHRYPAKFIPQLAKKLILDYTTKGDIVCDPFMGSGTTLVESIILNRKAIGVDINPVALLITKAKTNFIEPTILDTESKKLLNELTNESNNWPKKEAPQSNGTVALPKNERIDYWFPEKQKIALGTILDKINKIEDTDIKTFFLCAFSNILKNCSWWLMKSIKPTRDKNKNFGNPYKIFAKQVRLMLKKNKDFYELVSENHGRDFRPIIEMQDARQLPAESGSVSLVVTSPPYVTSYEYADLHQLTAFWLEYITNLQSFRKEFIGSIQKDDGDLPIKSQLAKQICSELRKKDRREAVGVERYFFEMQECFEEMDRILKPSGKACIVIGDTELKKVKIFNAEVFVEIMQNIGFRLFKIIKRPIPSKILPLTRNSKNGRFTSTKNADRLAYPFEYILIMEK